MYIVDHPIAERRGQPSLRLFLPLILVAIFGGLFALAVSEGIISDRCPRWWWYTFWIRFFGCTMIVSVASGALSIYCRLYTITMTVWFMLLLLQMIWYIIGGIVVLAHTANGCIIWAVYFTGILLSLMQVALWIIRMNVPDQGADVVGGASINGEVGQEGRIPFDGAIA